MPLKQTRTYYRVALSIRVLEGLLPLLVFALISCSSWKRIATTAPQQISQNGQTRTVPGQALPNAQAAQPVLSAQDKQIVTQTDALFTSLLARQQFSGSVLIAKDGQVLLAKGYSMANWQTNTPNTPLTRFYLGSVTKEFTAMSILILQQEGKLNVHQSICTYINPCPPPGSPSPFTRCLPTPRAFLNWTHRSFQMPRLRPGLPASTTRLWISRRAASLTTAAFATRSWPT